MKVKAACDVNVTRRQAVVVLTYWKTMQTLNRDKRSGISASFGPFKAISGHGVCGKANVRVPAACGVSLTR